MSYKVIAFTEGGIVVADGAVAAANMVASAISGEAVVFVVKFADNAVPAVEVIKNIGDLQQVTTNVANGDLNSNIKECFANGLGMMAAVAAMGGGPAAALVADVAMSEAFKEAYDAASQWSSRQDWSPLFDLLDRIQAEENPSTISTAFDPDLYRVPGLPSVIDPICNRKTTESLNWVPPRRDPLVLDLDGGGITTSGINPAAPILFDQDGDGIKTATGWIASGEAIVVRDLNGNGTIDSGRELFGDNTILTSGPRAGQTAANGFEALADLDSNADGKFDSNDADFASVKLWKDLNQDGESQANELFSFADLGVASINVGGTASNVALNGGNTQTFSGSFIKTGGQTGDAGTAHLAGSLLLSSNNFYREFTDDPTLTAEALSLPQMQGSGLVRDLRPAMSLGNAKATDLQAKVAYFAAGTTKAEQLARLDAVVQSWGGTSSMQVSWAIDDLDNWMLSSAGGGGDPRTAAMVQFAQANPTAYAQIIALEQFNAITILDKWVRPSGSSFVVSYSAEQGALIQQAYDALKESVYAPLVVQTRLKPYFDSIGLTIDEDGVHFDTTATIALVQDKATVNAVNAVTDLVDLQKYASATASAVGWKPYETLANILETTTITPELQTLLTAERITSLGGMGTNYTVTNTAGETVLGNSVNNALTGAAGTDQLYGLAGNDTLTSVGNGDFLDGGDGDDALIAYSYGLTGIGTTYVGGQGNDTMWGSWASDTYIFNLGDGQDTIYEKGHASYTQTDVLKFGAGIAPADVTPVRSGVDLIFRLAGGTDQITVKDWFSDSTGYYQIEQIKFADNTVWTIAQINARALEVFGTTGADNMSGIVSSADVLHGGAGNDNLSSVGNGDLLDGGEGDDALTVYSYGLTGNGTTYIGGQGNDTMWGSWASDTYIFNLGDGQDTIYETSNTSYTQTDVLRFGAGIAPADVTPVRSGMDLVFKLAGGTGQITVKDWFADGNGLRQIEEARFADGTVWTSAQINTRAGSVLGTSGADVLTGTSALVDTLSGLAGNDNLSSVGNGDLLDGGDGDDALTVYTYGLTGNGTTYIGGQGNDTMWGSWASDTYIFNLGDGQDTITEISNASYTQTDVLRFGAGIAPTDVTPVRSGVNLIFKLTGGTDQITVKDWFIDGNGLRQIEQVRFADGTTWTSAQISTRALEVFGTTGADNMTGIDLYVDVLHGGAGNDNLSSLGNGDLLDGGDGDDGLTVYTYGLTGNGTTYIGGRGNDTMWGSWASDTYIFNLGDGQDSIYEKSNASYAQTDVLKFGAGIAPTDVAAIRIGNDLIFKLSNGQDQAVVKDWFTSGTYQIEQIKFADNTVWTSAQINAKLNPQTGTAAAETINGLADRYNMISGLAGNDTLNGANSADYIDGGIGNDTMAGQAGNDTYIVDSVNDVVVENASEGVDWVESSVSYTLSANVENILLTGTAALNATGNAVNNTLVGNSGANVFSGGAGDDRLDGKAGADTLVGEVGNDTYVLGRGYGADQIVENDAMAGNTDVALFGSDIASSQLWFTHTGNDLEVSVIGTTDKFSIANWYLGSQYHVEQFKTSDGKTLLDSQVQSLVDAMAAFSPPAAGQTTLTASYSTILVPTIAANWQ